MKVFATNINRVLGGHIVAQIQFESPEKSYLLAKSVLLGAKALVVRIPKGGLQCFLSVTWVIM